ncbi:hypothetical protein N836_35425 [Leptolyngbya sp. Heron Island J]|uniref:hypothetical protein n=1 Tax=Leptolyngbya sp. Heron Island J TaxID=1385935 RepID=UPI0003B9847C|nr:hypothetical protein [Leptolyngbya sp. Heron Island J]ESA37666.1 hypothetical protein N836_35425 [Leptolyngbya sp. Heron Island J]
MSENGLRMLGVAVAFLLVFGTGFYLTHFGRPYGVALFTVHKLVATGILVFLGVNIYKIYKTPALGGSAWLIVSLAVLAFVVMIASGSVLSAVKSSPTVIAAIHKVVSYVTVLLAIAAFYLLLWRSP